MIKCANESKWSDEKRAVDRTNTVLRIVATQSLLILTPLIISIAITTIKEKGAFFPASSAEDNWQEFNMVAVGRLKGFNCPFVLIVGFE